MTLASIRPAVLGGHVPAIANGTMIGPTNWILGQFARVSNFARAASLVAFLETIGHRAFPDLQKIVSQKTKLS
jgi:hypothetical protein